MIFSGSTDGFSLFFDRLCVRVSREIGSEGVLTLSFEIVRGLAGTSTDLEFFTRLTAGSTTASGIVRFRDDRTVGSRVGALRSVRFLETTAGTVGGFR